MKPHAFDWTSSNPPTNLTPFQKFTRDVDWESSPLGPMAQWPEQLRQTVLMIMADPSPAVVYWGDGQTIVYNEAYVPLIGQKHPSLQGQDPKIGFAEIWDHFDGVIKHGQQTGETVVEAGAFLLLHRHGFLEETYFSWKFIPMIGEEGCVVGSYATVVEVTREMIFERRIATTEAIGMQMAAAKSIQELCSRILEGLEHNAKDIPFAVVYSVHDTAAELTVGSPSKVYASSFCLLEGVLGVEEGHGLAPHRIELMHDDGGLSSQFRDALHTDGPVLLTTRSGSLPADLLSDIEWRGFGVPCDKAVICPIRSSSGKVRVFLLIGLNPRRPYDPDYQKFISLLAEQVTKPNVQSVLFAEELRLGAELAQQAAVDKAELSKLLKLRTEQFERTQLRLTRFAERAAVGLAIHDAAGDVLYANQKWYDLASLVDSHGDPMSRPWKETFALDDWKIAEENWQNLIVSKNPVRFQARFGSSASPACNGDVPNLRKMGTSVLCTAYPDLGEDGSIKSIMTCVTDVSELVWTENQLILRTHELEESQKVLTRRVDEALEMKRQQENFIDMTSHEIRNPLSAIVQCTDDLSSALRVLQLSQDNSLDIPTDLYKNALESVDTITLCCSHQKSIVDDILTLSKLDSRLLEISPVPVQPRIIIKKLLQMFSAEMQAKGILVQLDTAKSIEELDVDWVQLDPSRVLQVLINLLTNAIKFTATEPKRSITVAFGASLQPPRDVLGRHGDFAYFSGVKKEVPVSDKRGEDELLYLYFAVQDTGKGLTTEETGVLFKRFSQASPRTYNQYGGSGLGLFISRQLVELQGGEIGVASTAGLGSTFAFYIMTKRSTDQGSTSSASVIKSVMRRLASDEITQKIPQTPHHDSSESSRNDAMPQHENIHPKSLDILLVEDNLINQNVVRRQLTKLGHTVHVANHGEEALEFLAKSKFWTENQAQGLDIEVVLMDIEMPVMDGLTCAREIRDLEHDGKLQGHLPIIAVTANARAMQMDKAKEAGMDDIVTKPFRVPALIAQVRELLIKKASDHYSDNESVRSDPPTSPGQ